MFQLNEKLLWLRSACFPPSLAGGPTFPFLFRGQALRLYPPKLCCCCDSGVPILRQPVMLVKLGFCSRPLGFLKKLFPSLEPIFSSLRTHLLPSKNLQAPMMFKRLSHGDLPFPTMFLLDKDVVLRVRPGFSFQSCPWWPHDWGQDSFSLYDRGDWPGPVVLT